jgi:hypothetical protein
MSGDGLKDVLARSELVDIHYIELNSRRKQTDSSDSVDVSAKSEAPIDVSIQGSKSQLLVRCRIEVENEAVHCLADIVAEFSIAEGAEISEELGVEFAEKVGVMVVYPYLREAVHDLASKMRLPPPLMLLARQGQIKLNAKGT